MTLPARLPKQITADSIARIDGGVEVRKVATKGGRRVLGSGRIESVEVAPGLRVMRADLTGQPSYDAELLGHPGLVVEIRLAGISRTQELVQPGRAGGLCAGMMGLVGCRERVRWRVTAPAQPAFRAVSLAFSQDFLSRHEDTDPTFIRLCLSALATEAHLHGPASVDAISLAECLLRLRVASSGSGLEAYAIALRLLNTCRTLLPTDPAVDNDMALGKDITDTAIGIIQASPTVDLTLTDVAVRCGVSPSTLKQAFHGRMGCSIGRYMRQERMIRAREMLISGCSVGTVAETLRYSSAEALSRAIKRQFGKPPSRIV